MAEDRQPQVARQKIVDHVFGCKLQFDIAAVGVTQFVESPAQIGCLIGHIFHQCGALATLARFP